MLFFVLFFLMFIVLLLLWCLLCDGGGGLWWFFGLLLLVLWMWVVWGEFFVELFVGWLFRDWWFFEFWWGKEGVFFVLLLVLFFDGVVLFFLLLMVDFVFESLFFVVEEGEFFVVCLMWERLDLLVVLFWGLFLLREEFFLWEVEMWFELLEGVLVLWLVILEFDVLDEVLGLVLLVCWFFVVVVWFFGVLGLREEWWVRLEDVVGRLERFVLRWGLCLGGLVDFLWVCWFMIMFVVGVVGVEVELWCWVWVFWIWELELCMEDCDILFVRWLREDLLVLFGGWIMGLFVILVVFGWIRDGSLFGLVNFGLFWLYNILICMLRWWVCFFIVCSILVLRVSFLLDSCWSKL